jgi:AcrR family transcriptional regulator
MAAHTRREAVDTGGAVDGHAATRDTGTTPLVPATARGEATRRRILDAAEEVFGELGYYEASVSEITRRAGVAQGTFYIYFHSKRETFIELVEDIGARLRAATSSAIRDATNRLEAERLGFEAFFRFVYEHQRIYRIVEDARRVAPAAARDYYRRISAGYERGLATAMQAGQIREDNVEALAYMLMGIGHFVAWRWLIWPSDESAEQQDGHEGREGHGASEGHDGRRQWQDAVLPDEVFAAVMEFITHGLAPAPAPR